VDSGEATRAVADLVDVLLQHAGDEDSQSYREALHRYAAELRSR
jgi:cyanophycin synthetase